MVNGLFVDAFCDYLEDCPVLVGLVRDVFQAVRLALVAAREERVKAVGHALGLPESANEQISTRYLNSLFQEFSLDVFAFTDQYYKQLRERIKQILLARLGPEGFTSFSSWLASSDLRKFLEALHKLHLHMLLNDPPIELMKSEKGVEYREFSKSQHHCLDGFPKDGAPCAIVIPPPARQGRVYQGLRPAVVIVKNPDPDVRAAVEKLKASSVNSTNMENAKVKEEKSEPEEKKDVPAVPANTERKEEQLSRSKTETETRLEETAKPETTRPVSMKSGNSPSKGTWPSRQGKRNHSMQIDEPVISQPEPTIVPPPDSVTQTPTRNVSPLPDSARRNQSLQVSRASTARAVRYPNARDGSDLSHCSSKDQRGFCDTESKPTAKDSPAVRSFGNPPGRTLGKTRAGDERMAKEIRRKLIQIGRQCRLQRPAEGNTALTKIRAGLRRGTEDDRGSNMPLQPSKVLTQQEKLLAYQRVLKAKLMLIKNGSSGQTVRPANVRAERYPEGEATSSYDAIKSSFQTKIQELNSRLSKFKKNRAAEGGKRQCQTFAKGSALGGSMLNSQRPEEGSARKESSPEKENNGGKKAGQMSFFAVKR